MAHVEEGMDKRQGMVTLSAPARVNLLGEHTDYSGGLVMPMAIPFATEATVSANAEREYRFRSAGFAGERVMAQGARPERKGEWSDYPAGVLVELEKLGVEPPPFTLDLSGNVPLGAGVSSSASVEVATCLALLEWSGRTLTESEIALLCQRAENLYVGSPCGIMDQFVITAARAGHALLLHTRTLEYELVPMNTGALRETCVVVCNSGVKHSVASGEYGVRRRQVEEGQTVLRTRFGVRDLGEATRKQLEAARDAMSHEAYLRCRHIITENARVREAREAMFGGDAERMGKLMVEAHASERDDFQCSVEEIDFLVETAVGLQGCFGARLTGGGFGGCTVNLVERDQAEAFTRELKEAYQRRFELEAQTYVCEAVDGALARREAAKKEIA